MILETVKSLAKAKTVNYMDESLELYEGELTDDRQLRGRKTLCWCQQLTGLISITSQLRKHWLKLLTVQFILMYDIQY